MKKTFKIITPDSNGIEYEHNSEDIPAGTYGTYAVTVDDKTVVIPSLSRPLPLSSRGEIWDEEWDSSIKGVDHEISVRMPNKYNVDEILFGRPTIKSINEKFADYIYKPLYITDSAEDIESMSKLYAICFTNRGSRVNPLFVINERECDKYLWRLTDILFVIENRKQIDIFIKLVDKIKNTSKIPIIGTLDNIANGLIDCLVSNKYCVVTFLDSIEFRFNIINYDIRGVGLKDDNELETTVNKMRESGKIILKV